MSGSNGNGRNGNGKHPAGPGAPSKYPECGPAIIKAVRAGCTIKSALQAVGVSQTTYFAWRKQKPEFVEDIQRARARGRNRRVAFIMRAARKDWRAALALLEREDPENWSLKQRIEHSTAPQPMGEGMGNDGFIEALDRMGEALESASSEPKSSRHSRLPD
jgi:hypothetical protein